MANFQAIVDREGRRECRFLLVVNNRIVGLVPLGGWFSDSMIKDYAGGMAQSARCFKKTAGVLVYEYGKTSDGQECWHWCHECETYHGSITNMQYTYKEAELPEIYKAA